MALVIATQFQRLQGRAVEQFPPVCQRPLDAKAEIITQQEPPILDRQTFPLRAWTKDVRPTSSWAIGERCLQQSPKVSPDLSGKGLGKDALGDMNRLDPGPLEVVGQRLMRG